MNAGSVPPYVFVVIAVLSLFRSLNTVSSPSHAILAAVNAGILGDTGGSCKPATDCSVSTGGGEALMCYL